jgi:drug/metabolite transporter (DMT)-like permease
MTLVSSPRRALLGTALALTAGAVFGGLATTGKLAYQEGANPATLILIRADVGVLLLWVLVLTRKTAPITARVQTWKLLAVGGLFYAAQVGLFLLSLERIPVGVASLLVFSYPALAALFGWLMGEEKVTALKLFALASALVGVALVLSAPIAALDPLGVVSALGAAGAQAAFVLAIRRVTPEGDPFLSASIIFSGAAVSLSIGTLLSGDVDLAMTSRAWGWALLHTAMLPLGITAYIVAVRLIGPTSTGIGDTFGPVSALLLGVAFLGERLSSAQMLGAVLVLIGAMTLPLIHRTAAAKVPRT